MVSVLIEGSVSDASGMASASPPPPPPPPGGHSSGNTMSSDKVELGGSVEGSILCDGL